MHGMEIPTRKRGRRPHPGKARALELARDPSLTMTDIASAVDVSVSAVSRWIASESPEDSAKAGETVHPGRQNSEEPLPIVDGSQGRSAARSGKTLKEVA